MRLWGDDYVVSINVLWRVKLVSGDESEVAVWKGFGEMVGRCCERRLVSTSRG